MKIVLTTATLLLALTGCGGEPEVMDARDTVFGTQVEALDKANEMEDAALESFERRNKDLTDQGG